MTHPDDRPHAFSPTATVLGWLYIVWPALLLVPVAIPGWTRVTTADALRAAAVTLACSAALSAITRFRLGRVLAFSVTVLLPVELFYRASYGGPITPLLLMSVYETSGRESSELLLAHPWVFAGGAIFLIVTGILATLKVRPEPPGAGRLRLAALLLAAAYLGADSLVADRMSRDPGLPLQNLREAVKYSFPGDALYSLGVDMRGRLAVARAAARRQAFVFGDVSRVDPPEGPELYVVVIGESSRRANWSMFGYDRDTNPELAKIGPDLFPFANVISDGNFTISSIPLALTRATPSHPNRAVVEGSVIRLAEQAGFDTYWISNQERYGTNENTTSAIAQEANHVTYVREASGGAHTADFDTVLLKYLDEIIEQPRRPPRLVLFLHTMGSHFDYRDRCPPSLERFGPSGKIARRGLTPARNSLVNEYDDSILATDDVLARIIERVRAAGGTSAIIYFSDHGERLFDFPGAKAGHGFSVPAKVEVEIPFFVWASDSYLAHRPGVAEALRRNRNVPASLDDFFDTFADMLSVWFKGFDPRQSLFSAQKDLHPVRTVLSPGGSVLDYRSLR